MEKLNIELPMAVQPSMRSLDGGTLSRICSWADEGEIERAGEKASRLLNEGVYDYQLVVLWCASRFAEKGILALGESITLAAAQLLQDIDAAAPADRTDEARRLDRAFSWMASNMTQRIHFHSKVRDDVWAAWVASADVDRMAALKGRLKQTKGELAQRLQCLPAAISPGELGKLAGRVESAFGGIIEQMAQARSGARGTEGTVGVKPDTEEVQPAQAPGVARVVGDDEAQAPTESRCGPPAAACAMSFGSERMRTLQRKLQGFEVLTRKGALKEAAIVARDVERELAQFEPLSYLPEVFEGYLAALLEHGAELEEYMAEGHGLEERALERLYQADPISFLRKLNSEGSG